MVYIQIHMCIVHTNVGVYTIQYVHNQIECRCVPDTLEAIAGSDMANHRLYRDNKALYRVVRVKC